MKKIISRVLFITGISLIALSSFFMIYIQIMQNVSINKNNEVVNQISKLMPERYVGFIDNTKNGMMPTVEINGNDYIGLIEVPQYGITLPLNTSKGSFVGYTNPYLLSGSIYDRSIIVGGSDQKGQLDFSKTISEGDMIKLTDMTGTVYSYSVSSICISDNANLETLKKENSDFTLFIKNSLKNEYTIIYLNL